MSKNYPHKVAVGVNTFRDLGVMSRWLALDDEIMALKWSIGIGQKIAEASFNGATVVLRYPSGAEIELEWEE